MCAQPRCAAIDRQCRASELARFQESAMQRSLHDRRNRRWTLAAPVTAAVLAGALASPRAARAEEQVPDGTFEGSLGSWYAYGVAAGPSLAPREAGGGA